MKRIYFIFIVIVSFFVVLNVNAATIKAKVPYSGVYIRRGPGTNYETIKTSAVNATFDMVTTQKVNSETGCSDGWYKIYYRQGSEGYICST